MSERSRQLLAETSERLRNDPGLPQENPTTSYWQVPVNEAVATLQSPQLAEETDVVIIGSGITGCSIARHLLQEYDSLMITVLEARTICSGATGRNGGHMKAVPEFSYASLLSALEKEAADEVVRFTLANVDELLKVAEDLAPDLVASSEIRKVESLNLFTDEDALSEFRVLLDIFERHNARRGRLVTSEELKEKYDVHHAAGGYVASAGAGWPYRLITSMFVDMLKRYKERLRVEALTPAQSIEYDEGSQMYSVSTPRGLIKARTIIHAANGHAGHLLPGLRGPLYPVRGQMTAQSPTETFGVQGGKRSWSIHYGLGFDYMTQSGQSSEIFLGGGLAQASQRGLHEIGNTFDNMNSILATAHLSGIINAVWPADERQPASSHVLAAWTGVMGFTSDSLPLVGLLPKEATSRSGRGEWIAAGFNGYGMANAWLCGKYIAEQILGRTDDGLLPRSYLISAERLSTMKAEDGAMYWMAALGLD